MSYTPKALGDVVYIAADDYTPPDLAITTVIPSETVSGISLIGWHQSVVGDASIRNAHAFISLDSLYQPARLAALVKLSGDGYAPPPLLATFAVPSIAITAPIFSIPRVELVNRKINGTGFDGAAIGNPSLEISQSFVKTDGFNASVFGFSQVENYFKTIYASGFVSSFIAIPVIENKIKYLNLDGLAATIFGDHFLSGGVRWLSVNGFDASSFTSPTTINTTANQAILLDGVGIAPVEISSPNVSPRILYPSGIKADAYGQPLVQRNPSPLGFVDTSYGDAWVSHSPRYLLAGIGDSFVSGYPQVFDPTRTIYLSDKGIEGGIFGDTAVKNTRRIITVDGFQDSQFSSFATIYSTRRYINTIGFDAQNFGNSEIYNKTPSLAPTGFDSLQALNPSIGYAIRHIYPSGFDLLKTGNAVVIKTPEIKPGGFNAQAFGTLFISNYTRLIEVAGKYSQEFGALTVWHRLRKLQPEGFITDSYGKPRIEHGRRTLLALGGAHSLYGQPWLSYSVRSIAVRSIYTEFASNHKVGGLQFIDAQGFIATEFGTRIIPEVQSLAPFGFSNSYGLATIDLKTKYITPQGFKTVAQEGLRFGAPKFYNLVQYITQNYDGGSGLVPPPWPQWTAIENRNKIIGAIGSNFSKVGEPNLYNNARLIEPSGMDSFKHSGLLIADRIRYLRLEGMEPPYISGWSNVHNDARVIRASGFGAQVFGGATAENTRRYYPRVGNWESLEFGVPMIADAIRTIDIESRYGINPPYIPVPDIHLYRRYLDEVGKDDHLRMGEPSLSIHFNIIAPRWAQVTAFGDAYLKNATPEVHAYGHNSELFGTSVVRTSFRTVQPDGSLMQLFGLSGIADRDRRITVNGIGAGAVGSALKVIKTGQPPYTPQYIWLDAVEIDGQKSGGYGIEPPERQVSGPFVRSNVIQPEGFVATRSGNHHLQSNGILVEPGIGEYLIGEPMVGLKNRTIAVPTLGDMLQLENVKPRLSPYTIYATKDTPPQAQRNNSGEVFRDVNSGDGNRPAGEVFGRLFISLQHRKITNVSAGYGGWVGSNHKVQLSKRYIDLKDYGFSSQRMGFHVVGPFDQEIEQFESDDFMVLGRPLITAPYTGTQTIKANGIAAVAITKQQIDLLHRTVRPQGFDAQGFGKNAPPNNPFMWQGMRIGERVMGIYGGFDALGFGDTFISNKVRSVDAQGFDSFTCEYDYTNFNARMRVTRQEFVKPAMHIAPIGFDDSAYGVPNIRPAAHYIRPDGNAEQYRKGAF